MSKFNCPEKLEKKHKLKNFDCDNEKLNEYLKKYAIQKEQEVIGYYTLTFGSVDKIELPHSIQRSLPSYQIPVMLLARLAVDKKHKGNGLGKGLLRDAILRTLQASEIAGIKAILVKAKDENAKNFYRKLDFIESPIDDLTLYLPLEFLKD
jgi:predicted N-acetyltransferase YhbS